MDARHAVTFRRQTARRFTLKAVRRGNAIAVSGEGEARGWTLCLRNIPQVAGVQGGTQTGSELGVVVSAEGNTLTITL